MTQIPENQIHHLKESLEENSFKPKIPWLLLVSFIVAVIVGALIYTYQFRDLPKCQDERVQILLNESIRSNEAQIRSAQTLAFERFREISHSDVRRICSTQLVTNMGNYSVAYAVINELPTTNWISRFLGTVKYSVAVEKIEQTQ
jgi:hypothetical protein